MRVIGLTGAAGSGKDTAFGFAREWCEEEGYRVERLAFADPLKESAAAALGYDPNSDHVKETGETAIDFCNELKQPGVQIDVSICHNPGSYGPEPQPPEWELLTKISGRQYLQFYGTEAHRNVFGEGFWTDATMAKVKEKETEGVDVVFITDTRFPNEGEAVALEGEVWSVERPGVEKIEAHVSEVPLPDSLITCIINNTGALEDLRDQVRLVCEDRLEVVA